MEQPRLEVAEVPVASLVPYAGNAKQHPSEQVDQIAASIREFGNCDPIAVWTNADGEPEIVEGHGRLLALQRLGIETAPVIRLDHLTDEQRRAYTHVHNQTTLNSGFDIDALAADIADLPAFDWESFGFEVAAEPVDIPPEADDVPEEAPTRVKAGQVWKLGEHRLMCGDSTDPGDVAVLMGGQRADVCFTSPPYNLNGGMNGGWETAPNKAMHAGKAYGMFEDHLTDDEYAGLLIGATGNALEHCDDVMLNIGILSQSKHGIIAMLARYADQFGDIIVWNKAQSLPHGMQSQRGMVSHRCELVFCFNSDGKRSFSHPQWQVGSMINRIDTVNASGNEYAAIHAATFPVEFASEVVSKFTDDSVLDLFGGTGTTIIAAEMLGRKCYMMELDPHYCDVIIQRWEDFTGGKAVEVDAL